MKTVRIVLLACVVSLFVSSAMGNLIAQFDGTSANLTPSGKIMTWYDQAADGGNNNAIGATPDVGAPDTRPLLVSEVMPNGLTKNVAKFDGINDNLVIGASSILDTNTLTWFMVMKADTSITSVALRSSYADRGDGNANNALWGNYTQSSGVITSHTRSVTGSIKARSAAVNSNEWFIVTAAWDGNTIRQWVNGVYSGALTGGNANPSGHLSTTIGAHTGGSGFFMDGSIAEIQIYDHAMMDISGGERETIEQDLMDTYFVPEPATMGIMALGMLGVFTKRK